MHQKAVMDAIPTENLPDAKILSGMFIGKGGANMQTISQRCGEKYRSQLDIKLKNHMDPFAFSIFVCANQPDTFTLAVELTQQHLINTYTDFYRNLQQEINGE